MSPRRTTPTRDILYGRQPIYEMLRAGRRKVYRLFLARGAREVDRIEDILKLCGKTGLVPRRVDQHYLDKLTQDGHHQGVAAEVGPFPTMDLRALTAGRGADAAPPFLLILDHIQDPQNVGSVLRTADAVGAHGVILPADRAATVTPAVVRASAGAAEHMRVCVVVNLARTLRELKHDGVRCVGLEGVPEAQDYAEADLTGPIALVLGSEGRGLKRLVRETCDTLIRLPLHGHVSSLNAGVAAGIALYEIARQRAL